MKIMTFFMGEQAYAVEVVALASVASAAAPAAPEMPVVQLATLLGAGGRVDPARAAVLVLRGEGDSELGVRVDRLGEVIEVDDGALRRVPGYFDSQYVRGVLALDDRLVVVLDSDAIRRGEGAEAGT